MKYFRKSVRGRNYRKRGVRRARPVRKAKPSRAFTKAVQKIINKNAEDKIAFTTSGNSLISFNSAISATGDVMQIMPNISYGNFEGNRVGDEIRAKKFQVKGYLNLAVDTTLSSSNKRIAVRLLVVQPKRYGTYADIAGNAGVWMPTLLKKGNTQTGFTGVISDLWAPINTDEITKYYDRVIYMSQDNIFQNTGSTAPTQQIAQNIQNTIKFFTVNLPTRNRKLLYDNSSDAGLQPTNFQPVLVLGYVHLDGSSPDSVETQVGLQYDATLHYQDM